MSFDNAKRIIQNSEARVASSAEGIYDDDLVVLFWQNIEAHYIDECIRYLNDSSIRSLTGPTTFYDITFNDDLFHLHAYYNESDQRIYRVLMKSAATTSSITQTATKWRLQSGETYQAGTSNLVLVMYNVSPDHIVSLETESLNETYTDVIYLLGGTQLTGTWHSIARESDFNSDTGLYDLRWYVSRYEAKEYIFVARRGDFEREVSFYRYRMDNDAIDDFENNYYFDTSTLGDYYYSADGSNYTKKNNASATGTLPSTAKNILTKVDNRFLNYEQRPDRDTGEIDVVLKFSFSESVSSTAESKLQTETQTVITNLRNSDVPEAGTPNVGTQVRVEAVPNEDGTFRTTKVTTTSANNSFSEETRIGDHSISAGGMTETVTINTNASTPLTSSDISGDIDQGITVSISNERNSDGTFRTVKTVREAKNTSATSGLTNSFYSETKIISDNETLQLGTPTDQNDGITKIHESTQNPDGTFRNISITRTARTDVTNVTDSTEVSDSGAGGYTESTVKKFNQSSGETILESDTEAGTIVTVENTLNEDGTFNTVKRIRAERETTASSGSKGLLTSETVTITNNAANVLGQPSGAASAGTTKINESQQLENGLFRNIERVITSVANDGSTDVVEKSTSSESIVRKYNQSSAENHNESEEADGTTIIIENNINSDGTFNTVKRTITATEINNCVDKVESSKSQSGGFVETITRNYNTTTKAEIATSDQGVGKVVSVENILNDDGTFNTVKSIKQFRSQKATSGSTNAFRSETVEIETNAGAEASAPTDQADGIIKIHQSEQLENGKFRNIKRTITARNDIGDVTDSVESSDSNAGGYLETVTKKINQSSQATIDESDTAAGNIITVENTINEDGTFNTTKRVRTDRETSAASGTSNNFRRELIGISNNAEAPLSHPTDQNDGTIAIYESEQLPNGLYRNVSRTIIARTDVATVTDSTEISDAGAGGYTETITKKYNQSSQATISESDTAAGSIVTVENTINDDGTFNTIERIKSQRKQSATAGTKNHLRTETIITEENADAQLGVPSTQTDGTIEVHESQQLENGKFRNTKRTIEARTDCDDITNKVQVGADSVGDTETTVIKYNQANPISADNFAAGTTVSVANELQEDGLYTTTRVDKVERKTEAEGGQTSRSNTVVRIITNNDSEELGDPAPGFKLTVTGTHSAASGTYRYNPVSEQYEKIDSDSNNYDETWTIFRDSQQVGTDTYIYGWLLYDNENNNQVYFSSTYASQTLHKTAEPNPTEGTLSNGSFSEKTIGLDYITDHSVIEHNSEQLPNGKFRNIQTITTSHNISTTSKVQANTFTETTDVNTANTSALTTSSISTGEVVTTENTANTDGTFTTRKTTRTASTSQPTVVDETISGNESASGYTETRTKKFAQSSQETISSSEDGQGKTIVVENILRDDGLFDTVKSIRTERRQQAIAGTASDEYIEQVTQQTNAGSQLGTPSYTAGKIIVHRSQQQSNGKFTNTELERTLSSQDFGATNPADNSINNSTIDFIIRSGFDFKLTTLLGIYKGNALPSQEEAEGQFKSGGREVAVKRISNPEIVAGKFNYYLYEDHYIAPKNDSDDWFIHSSTLTWQKNKQTIGNFISDNAGNTGWMPVDVGSVGGPKFAKIEQATRRTKTTIVYRKYFCRFPTAADLNTASINTSSNEMTTAASDTTISTAYKTVQLSQFLFAVEKTVITLGSIVADSDGVIGTTGASYSGVTSGVLT